MNHKTTILLGWVVSTSATSDQWPVSARYLADRVIVYDGRCRWPWEKSPWPTEWCYPLVMTNIAIENGHLEWVFPLKMVTFHTYVSLPEGKWCQMMLNGYKWAFDQPKTVSQNRRCILMGKNLMTIGIGPVTSGNIRYRKPFSGNLASSWDSHDGLYRPQWPSHLLKLVMEWNDGLLGIPPQKKTIWIFCI